MKKLSILGIIVFVSVLSSTLSLVIYSRFIDKQKAEYSNSIQTLTPQYASMVVANETNTNFTIAAEKSIHAVVHVRTKGTRTYSTPQDHILEYFYGYIQPRKQPIQGSGSGVLIDPKGYIVTNNHVISNSDEIEVTLNDKRSFKAELIGTDPSTDIAVLKINSDEPLPYLEYGNSDLLKVGEWVLAVGNPFNLTSTVTAGVVSAKARNIGIISGKNNTMGIESFIQTDAAVNPGNSGGALVNSNGLLIGINSAIASATGSFSGYSFAVPVSIAKKVVADIIQYGQVQRAVLGISVQDINDALAKEKNLDVLEGALVVSVGENSAAKDVDMREKDIITAINGNKISSVSELQERVSRYRPGDKITVTILRDGNTLQLEVVLKNIQGNTE